MPTRNFVRSDVRNRITSHFISDAIFSLLKTMPFSEITVTMICEEAQVHRTTFYKHFESKDHLMQYAMYEKYIQPVLLQAQSKKGSFSAFDCISCFTDNILNYIFTDTDYYNFILHSAPHLHIRTTLVDEFCNLLISYIPEDTIPPSVSAKIKALFLSGGIMSYINWCLMNKMPHSKDDMRKNIDLVISSSTFFPSLQ